MKTVSVNYALKWQLKFDNKYKWCDSGKLFNTQTGRQIKKTVNCRSVGYWIGKKFYTLNNLRKELEKIPKEICPF